MIITTKYDIGQRVRVLHYGTARKVTDACPTCVPDPADAPGLGGLPPGQVLIRGGAWRCPACNGTGKVEGNITGWYVGHESGVIVGIEANRQSIRNEDRDSYYPPNRDSYRLGTPGVEWTGGTTYGEHALFLGTQAECQTECDRRNEQRLDRECE